MRRTAWIVTLACLAAAAPARAQVDNRAAIGLDFSQRLTPDESTSNTFGVGLNWRIGHPGSGWGWHYGLGWYETTLSQSIGGRRVDLGEVHVRPLLGGYGYTKSYGRYNVTGMLEAGYAFTSFGLTDTAQTALRPSLGTVTDTHIGGTLVVRPEVEVWYDINRRLGLSVNLGYVVARPTLTMTTPAGTQSQRVRADVFVLTTGLVYSVF